MVIQLVSFDTAEGRKTGMLHDGKVYASGRFASMLDVLVRHWIENVGEFEVSIR